MSERDRDVGREREREGAKDALMELCKWRRPHNPLAKYSTRDADRTAVYARFLSACNTAVAQEVERVVHWWFDPS